MEEEITSIIEEIDKQGGMIEAIKSGWVDQEIEKSSLRVQKGIDSGEMVVVGQNAFMADEEEVTPGGFHKVSPLAPEEITRSLDLLRAERNHEKVVTSLRAVHDTARRDPDANLIPLILNAVRAYATQGEVLGAMRTAFGYHYDPLEAVEPPF
jgi:methylmalonyl-CoA mutase N-terminal domain/subunit